MGSQVSEIDCEGAQKSDYIRIEKIKTFDVGEIYCSSFICFPGNCSEDGKPRFVTASFDGKIRIFSENECEREIDHNSMLYGIRYIKNRNQIITSDKDGNLCIWDFLNNRDNLKPIQTINICSSTTGGNTVVSNIVQISDEDFVCTSMGRIYHVNFPKSRESKDQGEEWCSEFKLRELEIRRLFDRIEIDAINPNAKYPRQGVSNIVCLKTQKNEFMFVVGGKYVRRFNIKSNRMLTFNKKIFDFDMLRGDDYGDSDQNIESLYSFIDKKGKEIILTGEKNKITLWRRSGKIVKEITLDKVQVGNFIQIDEFRCLFEGFHRDSEKGNFDVWIYCLDFSDSRKVKVEKVHKMEEFQCVRMGWLGSRRARLVFSKVSSPSKISVFSVDIKDAKKKEKEKDEDEDEDEGECEDEKTE